MNKLTQALGCNYCEGCDKEYPVLDSTCYSCQSKATTVVHWYNFNNYMTEWTQYCDHCAVRINKQGQDPRIPQWVTHKAGTINSK